MAQNRSNVLFLRVLPLSGWFWVAGSPIQLVGQWELGSARTAEVNRPFSTWSFIVKGTRVSLLTR